jgi:hypothetical protein
VQPAVERRLKVALRSGDGYHCSLSVFLQAAEPSPVPMSRVGEGSPIR